MVAHGFQRSMRMPNYADGSAEGYYKDLTHYTNWGLGKFAEMIGQMLLEAVNSEELDIPDAGALHSAVIASSGIDNVAAVSLWNGYAGARKGDSVFVQTLAANRPPVEGGVISFDSANSDWLKDVFLWTPTKNRNFYTLALAIDFPTPPNGTAYLVSSGAAASAVVPNLFASSGSAAVWGKASAGAADQYISGPTLDLSGKRVVVLQRDKDGRFQCWLDGVSLFNQVLTDKAEVANVIRGSLGASDGTNYATGKVFGAWGWTSGEVPQAEILQYVRELGWQ